MNRNKIWFTLAIFWCVIIFIMTALPASTGSNTSGILQKLFNLDVETANMLNFIMRKSVHFIAFGLLGFLFYMGMGRKGILYPWVMTTLYAATDEWHQLHVPNRTGAVGDVVLDSIGAIIVLLIVHYLIKKPRNSV